LAGTLNFSEAILSPGASNLSEMTIEGLTFLIIRLRMAKRIAAILLPLPEINMPRFIIGALLVDYDLLEVYKSLLT
jgi:hypothetical protein